MLGDVILEGRGKRLVRRVLPSEGAAFKVEVTFESDDRVLGIEANETGTYWSAPRPDGTLYGEGQGVIVTKDGDLLTWKGSGVGRLAPGGAVSYRGAVYYFTNSAKFARLNSVAVVFEFEADADGNTRTRCWEWK